MWLIYILCMSLKLYLWNFILVIMDALVPWVNTDCSLFPPILIYAWPCIFYLQDWHSTLLVTLPLVLGQVTLWVDDANHLEISLCRLNAKEKKTLYLRKIKEKQWWLMIFCYCHWLEMLNSLIGIWHNRWATTSFRRSCFP